MSNHFSLRREEQQDFSSESIMGHGLLQRFWLGADFFHQRYDFLEDSKPQTFEPFRSHFQPSFFWMYRYNRSVNFACVFFGYGGFVCVWIVRCFGGFLSTFTTFLECQPPFFGDKLFSAVSSPTLKIYTTDVFVRQTLASLAARSSFGIGKKHQRNLEDHPTMGTHVSFIFGVISPI